MFTFVESAAFSRIRSVYLDDADLRELQEFLMDRPEVGDLVPGSGGIRKMRWLRKGGGKRGGLRVLYYVQQAPNEIWLLAVYAKAKQENPPVHIVRQLLEGFRHGKTYR